eukprot:CAMPEP_0206232774 /NCGR_PEP_ID=MMETSP0047_2-20121206/11603_1 /ASSEMBLY_ACC=CAM_ASM_000192 /TAXON_ID=195065 /ORGANISM="Chroomonas mesostigmatica_cf, Strain CCMP1168" /LENGTH=389 /DNA_ID=CAMNT_0053656549 /DNA_START=150 /DNA_END=1316 /DNA_ORIENTATION=+
MNPYAMQQMQQMQQQQQMQRQQSSRGAQPGASAPREAVQAAAPQKVARGGGGLSDRLRGLASYKAPAGTPEIAAKVTMISGCADHQTSADVSDVSEFGLPSHVGPGGAGGACTNALMHCLLKNQYGSYLTSQLLVDMRAFLRQNQYTQVPQLSTAQPMNLNEPFMIKSPHARRTKALLIGINYVGHKQGELSGCHNDVKTMQQFIVRQGFSQQNMKVLMDDKKHEAPTKANILRAFQWLIQGAQPGDALFLHYSGHGSQVRDYSGDEADGYDSTLVPVDYESAGQIVDDDLLADVIMPLPAGVEMFCVMDCCHSGTILDLPYQVTLDGDTTQAIQSGALSSLLPNPKFARKAMRAAGIMAAGLAGCAFGGPIGCLAGMITAATIIYCGR